MNDLNRSSTLSLRRPAAAALTSRPKASTSAAAPRQSAERSPAAAAAGTAAPAVRSETLLQGRSHVNIVHNGETYQLRATRLGKLILTK
ncbi:hemin uptake protein HemP [Paraburkholderia phenazinium]|jgi:hemin uptake protein HemP|uniref:Hemin uptake protein HemP n=1 Tax=Paraburkholderia phenazinium TaxID=60549 RepID=A0A1G7ZGU3_9BURK|nr:hemin uptake protein HemP [Paraburkholderia phenazinium]SDH07963.1 Hemin uptake protein HemP [Paraburkholderia phenazinium]